MGRRVLCVTILLCYYNQPARHSVNYSRSSVDHSFTSLKTKSRLNYCISLFFLSCERLIYWAGLSLGFFCLCVHISLSLLPFLTQVHTRIHLMYPCTGVGVGVGVIAYGLVPFSVFVAWSISERGASGHIELNHWPLLCFRLLTWRRPVSHSHDSTSLSLLAFSSFPLSLPIACSQHPHNYTHAHTFSSSHHKHHILVHFEYTDL